LVGELPDLRVTGRFESKVEYVLRDATLVRQLSRKRSRQLGIDEKPYA
jgi:hypothetical protein